MTKETKESRRKKIAETKKGFLGTIGLEDLHYGDTCFFEDIAYRGIRPIRLLADAIDNLQQNDNEDGIDIFLNEIQKKCDELMDACERWDYEEEAVKKEIEKGKNPFPSLCMVEQHKVMAYLHSIESMMGQLIEPFRQINKALLEKEEAPDAEGSQKDSTSGAK